METDDTQTLNNFREDAIWLDELAKQNGYLFPKPLIYRPGYYACIVPFIFTHGIVCGRIGDENFYDDRWCFHTLRAAKEALDAWDGLGEPDGWHRHPDSGRRRDLETGEITFSY